jgi:hypothetical protein
MGRRSERDNVQKILGAVTECIYYPTITLGFPELQGKSPPNKYRSKTHRDMVAVPNSPQNNLRISINHENLILKQFSAPQKE